MKRIVLITLGIFFFASLCFAQDYYAVVSHQIKDKAGATSAIYAITKVPNQEACKKVLIKKGQIKKKALINVDSFTGPVADSLFKDIFADKPAPMLYISFVDLDGYQTRTYEKVLTGSKDSTGAARKLPVESTSLWADTTMRTLKKIGIKNAKVILPSQIPVSGKK